MLERKCVFWFSLQLLCETFLILRRIQRGTVINMKKSCKIRHCATSRKAAVSIPDRVTGIFQGLNPSGRIVALGSTQPLTEMSTRSPSWG
jgi:hypothetical protein